METLIEKPCFYCSESCAGQPRVKDKQGRYAHKACQLALSKPEPGAKRSRRKSRSTRRNPEPDFLADLPDLIPSVYHTVAPCPTCAQRVHPRAVLCTNCGTDLTQHPAPYTASYIEAKPLHEHTIDLLAPARHAHPNPIAFPLSVLIGSALGAGLWLTIAPSLDLTPDPLLTFAAAIGAATLFLAGNLASRLQIR